MPLSWEDRLEIQDLMFRYVHLVDSDGPANAFLAVFSPDAIIESPIIGQYVGTKGIEAFGQSMAELRANSMMRHFVTNVRVFENGDGVVVTANFLQLNTPHGANAEPNDIETKFRISGSYDCKAKKVNGRWMLQSRTVRVDAMPRPAASG